MQIDLILATINRKKTLTPLLESIARQTYKNIRILLIDQNPTGYLDDILEYYRAVPSFPEIVHLHSAPGLSRARNVGLKHLEGEAFTLLDDDIVYPSDTLEKAVKALSQCDVAIGSLVESAPREIADKNKGQVRNLKVIHEAFYHAPSVTLFFKKEVGEELKEGFQEDIGAGTDSPYGSGAETDFLIRAMRSGFQVVRHPEIVVYHPPIDVTAPGATTKARRYGRGRWYLIKKYQLGYWFVMLNALLPLLKIVRKPLHRQYVRYQWEQFLGRLGV